MSHKVNWKRLPDHRPEKNTFRPLWLMTDQGIRMGRFNGRGDGTTWASWETGYGFEKATHWAEVKDPELPDGYPVEDVKCYM